MIEKADKKISFLDLEIFIADNTIHTREFRKDTSSNNYLKYNSAHARHTFPGIIKSQLYRLRRLCSREIDFDNAVNELKVRCVNSGYPLDLISEVLSVSSNLTRSIVKDPVIQKDNQRHIRLITLAGTVYENEFKNFAARMNPIIQSLGINIQVVKATSSSTSQLLFNNCDKNDHLVNCDSSNCPICKYNLNPKTITAKSIVSGKSYKIDSNLGCSNAGIYLFTGACDGQYTGKTTQPYSHRTHEHLFTDKGSAIYTHRTKCNKCKNIEDCSFHLVESYLDRHNYSLSEREHLWNTRFKSTINIQKTIK